MFEAGHPWNFHRMKKPFYTVLNHANLLPHLFGKNFVKTTFYPSVKVSFSFFHIAQCGKMRNSFSLKFRQINCLVISSVNPLLSRIFCGKSVRECGKNGNLLSHILAKNFVKSTFLLRKLVNI